MRTTCAMRIDQRRVSPTPSTAGEHVAIGRTLASAPSPTARRRRQQKASTCRSRRVSPAPLVKSPLSSLRPRPKQQAHPFDAQPVELVDRAQDRQPPPSVRRRRQPDRLHHAVEHLAVVDLDHIVAARDPQRLEAIGRHHADLRIRRGRGRADRVGVELHELAEASWSRLLVAEHPARAIGAVGFRQPVVVLGDIARERRGQVIAQRQPLLVVVLEREHALVRPILVGQKLAERVGIFDERRLDRLEPIERVDLADLGDHRFGGGEIAGVAVCESARQRGAGAGGNVGVVGHRRSISGKSAG